MGLKAKKYKLKRAVTGKYELSSAGVIVDINSF